MMIIIYDYSTVSAMSPTDRSGEPGGPAIDSVFASSTGFLLARIGTESRRRWTRALADLGLRPSHYGMLMALDAIGTTSQQQLAEMVGIDPRNAVPLLDELEGRSLIRRDRDPRDRRRHSLSLTHEGRDTMRRLKGAGEIAENDLLAPLTVPERARLNALLLKLLPVVADKDPAGDD
jgi:DNA-binding MarR family transcriptional regulator